MTIWLSHINPKNRFGYTMGWDIARPSTLLRSPDRTWYAGSMFKKIQPGDTICVYMKNIPKHPDGVYVVGAELSKAEQGKALNLHRLSRQIWSRSFNPSNRSRERIFID